MELKKCMRCGCFFASNNDVCCHCETKDKFEISKLKNYFEIKDEYANTVSNLAVDTGISLKNLNRYLQKSEVIEILEQNHLKINLK